jgi:hypothetical protein
MRISGLQQILLLCCFLSICLSNPERSLLFPEYCLYHGYPTETHMIKTKDMYNLKFFRLQGNF